MPRKVSQEACVLSPVRLCHLKSDTKGAQKTIYRSDVYPVSCTMLAGTYSRAVVVVPIHQAINLQVCCYLQVSDICVEYAFCTNNFFIQLFPRTPLFAYLSAMSGADDTADAR